MSFKFPRRSKRQEINRSLGCLHKISQDKIQFYNEYGATPRPFILFAERLNLQLNMHTNMIRFFICNDRKLLFFHFFLTHDNRKDREAHL